MLIGVTASVGRVKRAGKDTLADYLVQNYGFKKESFAARLKATTIAIFGFTDTSDENKEVDQCVEVQYANFFGELSRLGINSPDAAQTLLERFEKVFMEYFECRRKFSAELTISYRKALQLLGTDVFRWYSDDFWVNQVDIWDSKVVISDLRFDNEAEFIMDENGVIIEIHNPSLPEVKGHASEQGINPDYIDYRIINDGTLEDYHKAIDTLMQDVLGVERVQF